MQMHHHSPSIDSSLSYSIIFLYVAPSYQKYALYARCLVYANIKKDNDKGEKKKRDSKNRK